MLLLLMMMMMIMMMMVIIEVKMTRTLIFFASFVLKTIFSHIDFVQKYCLGACLTQSFIPQILTKKKKKDNVNYCSAVGLNITQPLPKQTLHVKIFSSIAQPVEGKASSREIVGSIPVQASFPSI